MSDAERQRYVSIACRGFRDTGRRGFLLKDDEIILYYPFNKKQTDALPRKFQELLKGYNPLSEGLLVGDRVLNQATLIQKITGACFEPKNARIPKNPRGPRKPKEKVA